MAQQNRKVKGAKTCSVQRWCDLTKAVANTLKSLILVIFSGP